MPTKEELWRLQKMTLQDKIALTKLRIQEWYEHWNGNVYVSFSGGKDSTVLLHLVREMYPEVPAVYVDTGLEYPEVKGHVKQFDNVIIIRPEKSFRQVINEYGWVYPSKDVAQTIRYAKKGSAWAHNRLNGVRNDNQQPSGFRESMYAKWKHLLKAPFKISEMCCTVMKERPIHKWQKENNVYPYIGLLASESRRRLQAWERTGCNGFEGNYPSSKPLSFWTEQDILGYIKDFELAIPTVYGEIIKVNGRLQTTGEQRTGCMFCLVGCHLHKPNKFQRMKTTHPKIYQYCMEQLGMAQILDYLGVEH